MQRHCFHSLALPVALAAALLAGCGGNDDEASLPTLSAATSGTLAQCTSLATAFSFAATTIHRS